MEKYLDKNSVMRLLQGVKTQIDKSKASVLDAKGAANGIASLDANGNIPLSQLGNVDTVLFEIVHVLPTELTEQQKNHIFIVPRGLESESDKNTYKEYIYTGEDLGHIVPSYWEELGEFTSEVDLKPYSKKSEAVTAIRFTSENSNGTSGTASPEQNLLIEFADGHYVVVDVPIAGADGYTSSGHGYIGNCGFMTNSDKGKLDKIDLNALTTSINAANTAAANTNKAIQAAETATAGAEKVDATITEENIFEVTDRTGTKKSLDMSGLVSAQDTIKELQNSKIDKTSILQETGESEDKVMSQKAVSDKLSDLSKYFNDKFSDLGSNLEKQPILSETTSSDFEISDEKENVLCKFFDGHFRTKEFDSRIVGELAEKKLDKDELPATTKDNDTSDLDLVDEKGNVLARLSEGHIRTKEFDSKNSVSKEELEEKVDVSAFKELSKKVNSIYQRLTNVLNSVVTIAASDAPESVKSACMYVCTGENDQIVINEAIKSLHRIASTNKGTIVNSNGESESVTYNRYSGGLVHLSSGTFYVSDSINVDCAMTLSGEGGGIFNHYATNIKATKNNIKIINIHEYEIPTTHTTYLGSTDVVVDPVNTRLHITLENFNIQGSGMNDGNVAIYSWMGHDVSRFRNITIYNVMLGIYGRPYTYFDAGTIENMSIQFVACAIVWKIVNSTVKDLCIAETTGLLKYEEYDDINAAFIYDRGSNSTWTGLMLFGPLTKSADSGKNIQEVAKNFRNCKVTNAVRFLGSGSLLVNSCLYGAMRNFVSIEGRGIKVYNNHFNDSIGAKETNDDTPVLIRSGFCGIYIHGDAALCKIVNNTFGGNSGIIDMFPNSVGIRIAKGITGNPKGSIYIKDNTFQNITTPYINEGTYSNLVSDLEDNKLPVSWKIGGGYIIKGKVVDSNNTPLCGYLIRLNLKNDTRERNIIFLTNWEDGTFDINTEVSGTCTFTIDGYNCKVNDTESNVLDITQSENNNIIIKAI